MVDCDGAVVLLSLLPLRKYCCSCHSEVLFHQAGWVVLTIIVCVSIRKCALLGEWVREKDLAILMHPWHASSLVKLSYPHC